MKILLVDDVQSNLGVLSLLVEEWFEDNEIDEGLYTLDEAYDGKDALEKLQTEYYDIIFLDIMMPIMDGIEALKHIRKLDLSIQPIIIMATALGDINTKKVAREAGANAYITKPVTLEMIEAMLNRYVDKYALKKQSNSNIINDEFEDDFLDFDDFDDFDDFAGEETSIQKDMMDKFNESHKKVPASVFLEDYPNLDYILEDMSDFDNDIHTIVDFLDYDNLSAEIDTVCELLQKYSTFLNSFMDFFELSTSLKLLSGVLENTNLDKLDQKNKEFIASFIKAILQDLQDWKDHVFVTKDAIDVFYINASSLNSCIQLESYIKNNS